MNRDARGAGALSPRAVQSGKRPPGSSDSTSLRVTLMGIVGFEGGVGRSLLGGGCVVGAVGVPPGGAAGVAAGGIMVTGGPAAEPGRRRAAQ
jgi:hypothetical protein